MNNLKKISLISVLFVLAFSFMSLKPNNYTVLKTNKISQDTTKWVAPASANDVTNPYEVNDENIAEGKLIYRKNCRSCHGRAGAGNGMEGVDLIPLPTDFTNPDFVKQGDGAIFWKTTKGRNDMKSYAKKLEEDEIWSVIMYIKTFSKVSEN